MLVAGRIAGHTPLQAVLRQMAVAEQDAVELCIILGQAVDRDDFGGNREAHVITHRQLACFDPLRLDLASGEPIERALDRLLAGHAADCPERMSVGDFERFQRMLDIDLHHRPALVVDVLAQYLSVGSALAQHQIADAHFADRLHAPRGIDRRLRRKALVHCDRGVVHHFQERHDALRATVGALDMAAKCAHVGPVVAQAAGELGQKRIFLDRFIDAVEVVGNRGEVARRKLRTMRAGVEQGRRARHEVEGRKHVVELDRARLALDFVQCQAHRDAHEECLR